MNPILAPPVPFNPRAGAPFTDADERLRSKLLKDPTKRGDPKTNKLVADLKDTTFSNPFKDAVQGGGRQPRSVSINRRKRSRRQDATAVFNGKKSRTRGGLKRDDLIKRRVGPKSFRVVSKRKSLKGKSNPWIAAVSQARKQLGVKFALIKKGTKLYILAKQIYEKTKSKKSK